MSISKMNSPASKMRIFMPPDGNERITLRKDYALSFRALGERHDRAIEYEIINSVVNGFDFTLFNQLCNREIAQLRRNGFTVLQVPVTSAEKERGLSWRYRVGWRDAEVEPKLDCFPYDDEVDRNLAIDAINGQVN
jgi:hypothetical protein